MSTTVSRRERHPAPLPDHLVLVPVSRRPIRLEDETLRTILDRPVPTVSIDASKRPRASIVVVTKDNLPFMRIALETVLASTGRSFEIIVVDNGSCDGTADYLRELAVRNRNVRVIFNETNRGFAAGCNQ